MSAENLTQDVLYNDWLRSLKQQVRQSQLKAKVAVNHALISLYWELGKQIIEKQTGSVWGSGFLGQLSKDLQKEFPEMSGFSKRNLELIRQWYLFYAEGLITKQAVSQMDTIKQWMNFVDKLSLIPWGHHVKLVQKIADPMQALFYIEKCAKNNWSRAVLDYQISTDLFGRSGKAVNNFTNTLPAVQSDLAREIFKDPYHFEFLGFSQQMAEYELENGLIEQISKLLLELGKGFAYLGRQFQLNVGNKTYRLDLLFYHTQLRCYVNIELKVSEFKPEYVGKLNFYVSAIDQLLKNESDNPTIGILLCKTKDDFEVEFSLRDIAKPIGVSEYRYAELPESIKSGLPSKGEFQRVLMSEEKK